MATRKYEQRLRAESTEETRRRILDAVYERLRVAPSEPVSLDRVARLARVARNTIYLAFGSRAGLFEALGSDLLQRGGFDRMLQEAAHPDAREALRGGIRGVVAMYATYRDVLRALHSMAQLDAAAVGDSVHAMEQRRADGMTQLAQRLTQQGLLRPDTTLETATDLLWVLTSFETFDLLHTGRARSVDDTAATLTAIAERDLCVEPEER